MSAIARYAPPILSNLPLLHQGKVRDTFPAQWPDQNDKQRLPRLPVATDRMSTHNVVHRSTIPKKGEVLNAFTIFWMIDVLEKAGILHHLVAYGKRIYDYLPGEINDYPENLHYRAIVVKSLDMDLVEFVFRAYLDGNLWTKSYSKGLPNPYGIELPPGLPRMTCFDTLEGFGGPIFTPTEKSDTDDPLPAVSTEERYREGTALARRTFNLGRTILNKVDIEEVDGKFEVGVDEDGNRVIGDEALTPDSSRFTTLSEIKLGEEPKWKDKQITRNKAEEMWAGGEKVSLEFPPLTIAKQTHANIDLFEQVVGMSLHRFQKERLD
ncbi:MAG: phosphoribosylaminoimidazolesuccinocarboxamide synthase [Candidatus Adlerbacteria bacterium]|nr:phosphoribosylaminoimidazolesuccinocarboxamide synthase [Candidatus Adlerbacteria bacterium]